MYKEFIDREIIKETEKAYLAAVKVNNPRDGWHEKRQWVAKSICRTAENQEAMDMIPESIRAFLPKYIGVPTTVISDGEW